MRTAIALSIATISLSSMISLSACQRRVERVVLWPCDNSVIYLNRLDTCIMVKRPLSEYSMSLSIRHHDDFRLNGIRFGVEVSYADSVLRDTILMQLADSIGCWKGTPYIGAYVMRVPVDIALPSVDSAVFSITPLLSDAKDGVDWLAFELKRNE